MNIILDKEIKIRLKQAAKDEGRTLKKQIEVVLKYSVEDIELDKQPAGFKR